MTNKLYTLDDQFIEETDNWPTNFTGIIKNSIGSKFWNAKGKYHRLDGPACEYSDGSKEWFVEGKRHRLDGPSYVHFNGSKHWYVDGKRHRLDGPAYISFTGLIKTWYVDGKEVTEEQCNLLHSIMKLKGLL